MTFDDLLVLPAKGACSFVELARQLRGVGARLAEQREEGMLYQVLTRASAEAAWEPYQAMTRDPLRVMALMQKASRIFPEVSVIQAESASLLREQARLLRAGEPSGQERSPLPSLSATPRVSMLGATIESQRWAYEQGPGGDHDVPYRFESPISAQTLAHWARLMARAQPSDALTDAADDGAIDDAIALEIGDTQAALAPEPAPAPTKRIL